MARATVAVAVATALCALAGASALQMSSRRINASAGNQNVCMMGHLAPEYFLLGVPKGGTTYFFLNFARSSALVSYKPGPKEQPWHAKEPWFFAPHGKPLSWKLSWLQHYPGCTQKERKVAFDGTPGYFGYPDSAKSIYTFYAGTSQISKLTFMVFLRNPVSRSHSHYYHYVSNGVRNGAFGKGCPADVFPSTFAEAAANLVNTGAMCGKCLCNDVFESSMYAASFREYFKYFSPNQFHVIPFEAAVKPELVEYAWDVLRMPHGQGARSTLVGNGVGGAMNHHDYPKLEEDLESSLLSYFRAYLEWRAGAPAVAQELVNTNAHLYNYRGRKNSKGGITIWLESQWGS